MNAVAARGAVTISATNLFAAARHSLIMATGEAMDGACRWSWASACAPAARGRRFRADTPAETRRVAERRNRDPRRTSMPASAAARCAPRCSSTRRPPSCSSMMTRCADALQYVPHLRPCRVRDRAPDDSWLLVEHEIDFGWYAPRRQLTFPRRLRRRPQHRVPPGQRRLQGQRRHLGIRSRSRWRDHAAALPRLHRPAGLRAELAGALHLQARTAADAGRPAPTL